MITTTQHILTAELPRIDPARVLASVRDLDDEFVRYDNPFEQKWALPRKYDLPKSIEDAMNELAAYHVRMQDVFDTKLYEDTRRHYNGIFRYDQGDKLDVHVDAGISPVNGMRKHVTALLYLTEGAPLEFWSGESCVDDHGHFSLAALGHIGEGEKIVNIYPYPGLVVFFENNDYAWHGVPREERNDGRVVLTVSFLSLSDEFKNRRQRAYFVPRPGEWWEPETFELRDRRADPERYAEVYRT